MLSLSSLADEAVMAMSKAKAPESKVKVGAALEAMDEAGHRAIFTGFNVEDCKIIVIDEKTKEVLLQTDIKGRQGQFGYFSNVKFEIRKPVEIR